MSYAKTVTLHLPYHEAVPKVKEAFKDQGFGTLTKIDVRATLAEKLGAGIEPYVILGTCNAELAHRALEVEPAIGLLCPATLPEVNGAVRLHRRPLGPGEERR